MNAKELHRYRHWQGELLLSRDFRYQNELDDLRRRLHNRALHDVPGSSIGLAVKKKTNSPLVFTVECGLAYDQAGRELLLPHRRDIDAPPQPSWLILRLREETPEAGCCPPSDPGCVPEAQPDGSSVELYWHPFDSLRRVNGVVLGQATSTALDATFVTRMARPLVRPRLARGETIRGNTPWELWQIDEPDGRGGLKKTVVGVQTYIDTSAAGFTARDVSRNGNVRTEPPHYFATLTSPSWDLDKTEFAPAFFPHVADATPEGFIFRLLMAETGRRRYPASFGTARVTKPITLDAAGRMQLDVTDAAAFRKDDFVALLRPRGDTAFAIGKEQPGGNLTLAAPLPTEVEVGTSVLALGNEPRAARVTAAAVPNPTVLVAFTAPVALKKNDVLVRFLDAAVTVVNGISSGALRIEQPFDGWKKEDKIGFAQLSTAVGVLSVTTLPNDTGTRIVLSKNDHHLDPEHVAIHLDDESEALADLSRVTKRDGDTIEVSPALSAEVRAKLTQMALVLEQINVTEIRPQKSGEVVTVEPVGQFRKGDFVAVATDPSKFTVIDKVDVPKKQLSLRDPLSPPLNALLVAANWLGATTVDQPATPTFPNRIVVGRADAVPASAFLVVRDGAGFGSASKVRSAAGTVIDLETPLAVNRLDSLAIGVFPKTAIVALQEPDQLRLTEAGALSEGDIVMRLGSGTAAKPLAVVAVASPGSDAVVLGSSLGTLQPGDRLGVVHFRDTANVISVTPADRAKVKVDRQLDPREGDFVAPLTHYFDNSANAVVDDIQGTIVTLRAQPFAGDGIVDRGWIDGGILGAAAVSPWVPFIPVRLESTDGLDGSRPSTAYGFDLLTGEFVATSVYAYVTDSTVGRVYIMSPQSTARRYRPETFSLVTTFNAAFSGAFANFAQQQKLAVSWIGCQQEFDPPTDCSVAPDPQETCPKASSSEK